MSGETKAQRWMREQKRKGRRCQYCGQPIPETANARTRYCSTRCRVATHRARS